MQDKSGIREVKSIEFFKERFTISILSQITKHGYQENELIQIWWMDYKDKGMFLHQDEK